MAFFWFRTEPRMAGFYVPEFHCPYFRGLKHKRVHIVGVKIRQGAHQPLGARIVVTPFCKINEMAMEWYLKRISPERKASVLASRLGKIRPFLRLLVWADEPKLAVKLGQPGDVFRLPDRHPQSHQHNQGHWVAEQRDPICDQKSKVFPKDDAVKKVVWLAIQTASQKCTMLLRDWTGVWQWAALLSSSMAAWTATTEKRHLHRIVYRVVRLDMDT